MSLELRDRLTNKLFQGFDLQLFADGDGAGGNPPPAGNPAQTFTADYVRDLRNESAEYRTKLRATETERDTLQTRLKALEDGSNALLERAREALKLDAQADFAAVTTKLVEVAGASEGMAKKAEDVLLKAAFLASAAKANVVDPDAAFVLADLASVKTDLESMSVFPVDKDGKQLTKDGKPVTGLDDVVTTLLEAKPYLKGQGAGGSTGQVGGGTNPPGAGGGDINPWRKDTFNLTEQGKLLRENPTLATRYRAEAGVK